MNKNKGARFTGLGIGYVSIIILFVIIALTVLAVLSFQAAGSDIVLTEKSAAFTAEYYAADTAAKQKLAELDGAAEQAGEVFFEDSFAEAAEQLGASAAAVPEGVRTEYSVAINERQQLYVSVVFFSAPEAHGGERYRVDRWQSGTETAADEDEHLVVWDGTF